jgi:multimeric flavodoxin WrbA
MKIIIINGSPRTKGATGQILSQIRANLGAMNTDVEIEYVDLGKMDLRLCDGCMLCYKKGFCHIKDDGLEALSERITQCDGVVFGSPTYASNVSAHFKTLTDRGHFIFEQLLKNKACFSVVTYENYGGKRALQTINELIRYSGGAVSCKYLLKLNHGTEALNAERKADIEKLCRRFLVKTKKKGSKSFYDRLVGSIAFNFVIKPHVAKNESRYQGIISRWLRHGLISKG